MVETKVAGMGVDPEDLEILPVALAKWVAQQPDKRLWTWLDDHGKEEEAVTYQELDDKSAALASLLLAGSRGVDPVAAGDRLLLIYPPGLSFIIAFVACVRAGFIAVPVYPPDPRKLQKELGAFSKIAKGCGARLALTSAKYDHVKKAAAVKDRLTSLGITGSSDTYEAWPDLQWIVTDKILANKKESRRKTSTGATAAVAGADDGGKIGGGGGILADVSVSPHQLAFLQYTSGSTSDPKGVKISHLNLAHNLTLIIDELHAGKDTIVVSWLPQYHDMGLIGSLLGAMYSGGSGYYMSPLSFVRDPPVWIGAISRYKGTHLQAPNFAYALSARKWRAISKEQQLQLYPELDLSSVQHMINGAEPIDPTAMDSFAATFAAYGFNPCVIYPTYGLAEHTVFVCSNGRLRLRVDKIALETDKIVRVISKDDECDEDVDNESVGGGESGGESRIEGVKRGRKTGCNMVGCGIPRADFGVQILIVDAEEWTVLADGQVGEVWVRSPSKANGYWGMYIKSLEDFCAVPKGMEEAAEMQSKTDDKGINEETQDWSLGYLRTGDEGFLWGEGSYDSESGDGGGERQKELFICGRIKDLIIIDGRNYYPQDLEKTAEMIAGTEIRPGCSAAFSVQYSDLKVLTSASNGREKKKRGGSGGSKAEGQDAAADIVIDDGDGDRSGEGIVLAVELRAEYLTALSKEKKNEQKELEKVASSIITEIVREHGVQIMHLVLLPPKTNKKTTSGKIARQWCRKAYLNGDMTSLFDQKNTTAVAEDAAVAGWDENSAEKSNDVIATSKTAGDALVSGGGGGGGDRANRKEAPGAAARSPGSENREHAFEEVDLRSDDGNDGKAGGNKVEGEARNGGGGGGGGAVRLATLTDAELLDELTKSIGRLLDGAEVFPNKPLYDHGMTSVAMAQLSGGIQADYGAHVPVEVLDADSTTPSALVGIIRSNVMSGAGGVTEADRHPESSADGSGSLNAAVAPQAQMIVEREKPGCFENWVTRSCPCCYCLLRCPCFDK